jgi:hypothetical protein
MAQKRVAVVGTAPSWAQTPWDDPSLEIWSLNDAYMCRDAQGKGLRRADRWYEQHPIDKLWFRPHDQKVIYAHEIPEGHYVRPAGHLNWLKDQAKTIPVYLQETPPADWPANARRFPIEEADRRFGIYWASGPSYMVAHAIMEGYREIHVYGIHLSTEAEYREQRPNFEHLLGIARGLGITVKMAQESPVLKHGWKYGYEPRPRVAVPPTVQAARKELKGVREERAKLVQALVAWPRWKTKAPAVERLTWLEILESDLASQISRWHAKGADIRLSAATPAAPG